MKIKNKDINTLVKEAMRHGWTFRPGKKHLKGVHASGQTATISLSPSDARALDNMRKHLKLNEYRRIESESTGG